MSVRALRVSFLLLANIFLLFLVSKTDLSGVGTIDLLQYWAGAHAIRMGENPYDSLVMEALQNPVWPFEEMPYPILLWNPPQVFTLVYPLGFLSFSHAVVLWLCLGLILIFGGAFWFSSTVISRDFLKEVPLWKVAVVVLSFPPIYVSLYWGQLSPSLFAGFILFLALYMQSADRSRMRFLSGLALSLTLLKPHLLFLLYLILVWEAVCKKKIDVLAGIVVGAVILSVTPLLLSPALFSQYLAALKTPPVYFKTPTVGSWLQEILGSNAKIWRFLPTLGAVVAALVWMSWRRIPTSWVSLIFLSIPLSLVASPYGWAFDQLLLLPLVLVILYHNGKAGSPISLDLVLLFAAHIIYMSIPSSWGQHYMVWYPVLIWALMYRVGRRGDLDSLPGSKLLRAVA